MNLVFDHRMFEHVNQTLAKERGTPSRAVAMVARALRNPAVRITLGCIESVISVLLSLPIPIYSGLIYAWITHSRGLPRFSGMYLRGLYYRRKLGRMGSKVFIDQGVFFAFPRGVELAEFSFMDQNVIIMSKTAKVGRRVHIAPRVFVSGGGRLRDRRLRVHRDQLEHHHFDRSPEGWRAMLRSDGTHASEKRASIAGSNRTGCFHRGQCHHLAGSDRGTRPCRRRGRDPCTGHGTLGDLRRPEGRTQGGSATSAMGRGLMPDDGCCARIPLIPNTEAITR